MTSAGIELLPDDASLEEALAIRRAVFVEEQDVPEAIEYDDLDEDATHLLARDGDVPVGTARLRPRDRDALKVERVAVLPEHREEGWGRRLMETAEAVARDRRFDRIVLHGQTTVETFYHELGYRTTSDVFEEAGIPHVEMEKGL